VSGADVDQRVIDITKLVRAAVTIPVAVKLSPFYSSIAHLASQLDAAGASGLVLFNRFYQPDIDVEMLDVSPQLKLSDSSELLLRVRWLAILAGRLRGSLACSGGVHTADDAVKAIMAGADAVQLVSVLLRKGPEHLAVIRSELRHWMEAREYESVSQMRGSMSLDRSPDPAAYERGNYLRLLQTWRRPDPYARF
jgi:dihydroorotate dehydrogenase (fumarate)